MRLSSWKPEREACVLPLPPKPGVVQSVPPEVPKSRSSAELSEIEPAVRAVAALHVPGAAIVDYRRVAAALAAEIRPALRAIDVVRTAKYAALEPWWHRYTDEDDAAAMDRLERMGVAWAAERSLGTLSSGEQQRVLLARTLMNDPGVVLLDEPSARLDLGGREQLVEALAELTTDPTAAPLVLVTHHLDEVPPGMTHVLMLRDGEVVARGPIGTHLTAAAISRCFGMPLQLQRRPDGRYSAWLDRG